MLITVKTGERFVYTGSSDFIYGLAHSVPLLFSNVEKVEIFTQVEQGDCKYVEDPVREHLRVVL